MRYKCIKCLKKCEDIYKDVNKFNVRIYCDECINKIWKIKNENKKIL